MRSLRVDAGRTAVVPEPARRRPNADEPRRILIAPNRGIGSVLAVTRVVAALRGRYPQARIVAMADPAAASLLESEPRLDRVLVSGVGAPGLHPGGWLRLVRDLRAERPVWALVTTPSRRVGAAIRLAGVPRRIGVWRGGARPALGWAPLYTRSIFQLRSLPDETAANIELLRALGIPPGSADFRLVVPPPATRHARRLLDEAGIGAGTPFVALYPGTEEGSTGWPPEYYARLGERLAEDLGIAVVVTGVAGEMRLCARIVAEMDAPARNLAGQLPLPALAAALAEASLCIASDPGALRLAASVGTPTIALRPAVAGGASSLSQPDHRRIELVAPDDCHCEAGWRCPRRDCLRGIKPGAVFTAAGEALERNDASSERA